MNKESLALLYKHRLTRRQSQRKTSRTLGENCTQSQKVKTKLSLMIQEKKTNRKVLQGSLIMLDLMKLC